MTTPVAQGRSTEIVPHWIRVWHFVHALTFLVLVATGWHLYFGEAELWGYARSYDWHRTVGIAAAILATVHPLALLVTGEVRAFHLPRRGLGAAIHREIRRYTLGLWRGEPLVRITRRVDRLNPVQRLLYAPLIFLVLPGLAVSGLVLLAPGPWFAWVRAPAIRATVAAVHAWLAMLATLFLLVHLYMATMTDGRRILPTLRRRGPFGLVLFSIVLPNSVAAEVSLGHHQPTLQCVGCHSGTQGSRRIVSDPRTGRQKDVTVELALLKTSVHGEMNCRDCHSRGFDRFPHRPAAERRFPACRDCHPRSEPLEAARADAAYDFPRLEREHAATAHAAAFRKVRGERDCEACHHPHYMRTSASLALPSRLRAVHDAPCRACHDTTASGPLADPLRPDPIAAHAAIPDAARHLRAARCIDCHASRDRPIAHDLLNGPAAEGCVDCHRRESALLAGLWRFVPDAGATRDGFTNARLLDEHHVPAVTRPAALDRAAPWALSALAVAISAHLGLRLAARLRRSVRRTADAG